MLFSKSIKTVASSAVLLATTVCSSLSAHAADEVWTGWVYISSLQTTMQNTVYVSLQGGALVTCGSGDGQVDTYPKLHFSDEVSTNNVPQTLNGGFDRVYASLMTAKVAGLEVRLRLSPSTDGRHCFIEQMQMR